MGKRECYASWCSGIVFLCLLGSFCHARNLGTHFGQGNTEHYEDGKSIAFEKRRSMRSALNGSHLDGANKTALPFRPTLPRRLMSKPVTLREVSKRLTLPTLRTAVFVATTVKVPILKTHVAPISNTPVAPILNTPETLQLNCGSTYTCSGKCVAGDAAFSIFSKRHSFAQPECKCDNACNDVFGDCCDDFGRACPTTKSHSNASDYFYKLKGAWRCVYVSLHNQACHGARSTWMVARCPDTWPDGEVKSKCHNPTSTLDAQTYLTFLPVVGLSDLLTYRNQYCAQCNDVARFEHWTMIFKKDAVPPPFYSPIYFAQFISENRQHFAGFLPKEKQRMRWCTDKRVITTCPNTSASTDCEQGTVGLVEERNENKIFRNKACALCNGYDLTCGISIERVDGCIGDSSISRAISLRDYGVSTTRKSCKKGEVFDTFVRKCRKTYNINDLSFGAADVYQVTLWVLARERFNDVSSLPQSLLEMSLARHYGVNKSQITDLNLREASTLTDELEILLIFKIRLTRLLSLVLANEKKLNGSSKETTTLRRLFRFEKAFHLRIDSGKTLLIYRQQIRQLNCTRPHTYRPGEYVIEDDLTIRVFDTNTTYQQQEYFMNASIGNGSVTVCLKTAPSRCEANYIQLNSTDYYITENLTSVYNTISYNLGDYIYRDDKVYICVDFKREYETYTTRTRDHIALVIITWIGFVSSIVCLLALIITYSIFNDLRKLPGKNLLNLSVTLCMAKLLWLLGSVLDGLPTACAVTARATHYFFLAFFSASSVVAFHSCLVFGRKMTVRRSPADDNKLFVKYSLAVWLLPAAFLLLFGLLDHYNVFVINYGAMDVCWLGTSKSKVALFIVPFGVFLLHNLVQFIAIALRLRQNQKSSSRRLGVDARDRQMQNVKVCVKLSTLLGFSWLFGLLQVAVETETDAFSYLFVIFVSLQGVFICAAFLFQKKIFDLYRGLILKHVTTSTLSKDKRTGSSTLTLSNANKNQETKL